MAVTLLPTSFSGMSIVDWLVAGFAAVAGWAIFNNFADDLERFVEKKV